MKKRILTIASVSVLTLASITSIPVAANQGPNEPVEIQPGNYSKNVSLNPTLEAVVTESSGEIIKSAEFKEGYTYDFSSANSIIGFQNKTADDPFLTNSTEVAVPFSGNDIQAAAFNDGKSLITESDQDFPSQRFEVNVSEKLKSGSQVELYWKGKTHTNGEINLSAWDHQAGKWETLTKTVASSQEEDIVLTAAVDQQKFINAGKIQAMVHTTLVNTEELEDPFTMLWFTDTQYYARDYPEVWESMTDYMVAEYQKGTYEYAFHTGDLVDTPDSDEEWAVADKNLTRLEEAGIPYGVLAGNHDVIKTGNSYDYSYFHKYVGADRYNKNPWYGGQMDNNRNHYDLFSFGNHDFIMLYLGYGTEAEAETIQWANGVLEEHSERNAILAMHWNIDWQRKYDTVNAQIVHDKIALPNANVKMVLSGHHPTARHRVLTVTNPDGSEREILEVVANYQGGDIQERGGYLRLLTFDPNKETVEFVTYSPYLKDYNAYYGEATFTENYNLIDKEKDATLQKVETDYVAVNIYQDKLIGADYDVKSGEIASVEWSGLAEYTEYFWYMNLTNQSGLEKRSKIQRFTTGDAPEPMPTPEPDPEPAQPTFPDVGPEFDWAVERIEAMVARGIIVGHTDSTFKPANSIERQHVALMFTKALPLTVKESNTPFIDVTESHRFYEEITRGQQAGIFDGYNNFFRPNGYLTRAEMAKILVVAFDIKADGNHEFPDVSESHWANDYISILYSAKIAYGIDGEYRPEEKVTRAQFAVFMYRALEYYESKE